MHLALGNLHSCGIPRSTQAAVCCSPRGAGSAVLRLCCMEAEAVYLVNASRVGSLLVCVHLSVPSLLVLYGVSSHCRKCNHFSHERVRA